MDLFLTVDVGTSGTKIAVFDESCNLISSTIEEYNLITPKVDYVEINPEEYYRAFKDGLSRLPRVSKFNLKDIRTVCVCSQAETFVILDKNETPLMNAIVWLDNRAIEESEIIEKKFGRRNTFHITGQQDIVPTWTACKLLWLKGNQPDLYKRINNILFVEDFLIYKLTGKFFTDFSLLPSSLLFDIVNKKWWSDMLSFLNISEEQLSIPVESGEIIGELSTLASKDLGLSSKVVVISGAQDHMAGLIGSGNIKPGVITETTGTALAICTTIDEPFFDENMRIPCYIHSLKGKYMLLPWSHNSGIVLRWFRDKFFIDVLDNKNQAKLFSYNLLTKMASKVNPGSDGLIMLPFLSGAGSPELNPKAKGVFYGISLAHGKGHFLRAIMESIAYVIKSNIQALEEMNLEINEIRSLGGGSKSDLWCQIKSDVLNKKVIKLKIDEVSLLGLAILSGIAVDKFSNVDEAVKKCVSIKKVFSPNKVNVGVYEESYQKYKIIYQKLKDIF